MTATDAGVLNSFLAEELTDTNDGNADPFLPKKRSSASGRDSHQPSSKRPCLEPSDTSIGDAALNGCLSFPVAILGL